MRYSGAVCVSLNFDRKPSIPSDIPPSLRIVVLEFVDTSYFSRSRTRSTSPGRICSSVDRMIVGDSFREKSCNPWLVTMVVRM